MPLLEVVDRGPDYVDPTDRTSVSRAVDRVAMRLRNTVVADISPAEMAAWPLKLAEAERVQAGDATDTPRLTQEAEARGITLQALAALVIAKANVLSSLEAAIAGEAGRRQDALRAADAGGVAQAAVDLESGWPRIQ